MTKVGESVYLVELFYDEKNVRPVKTFHAPYARGSRGTGGLGAGRRSPCSLHDHEADAAVPKRSCDT